MVQRLHDIHPQLLHIEGVEVKIHVKKKQFRLMCKLQHRQMRMNDASGSWIVAKGTTGQHVLSGSLGKLVQV